MRSNLLLRTLLLLASLSGCVAESLTLLPEGGGGQSPCAEECNGICTSVDDDPLNCGACGHDCFGGICDSGHCQAVAVATGEPFGSILADETHVYWGGPPIKRSTVSGLDKETLLDNEYAIPNVMAVDATHLYWTMVDPDRYNVMRMPKGGGTEQVLAEDQFYPAAVAVDEQFAYWTSYGWDAVRKTPLAGGPITTLATGQVDAAYITVYDGHVVWSNEGLTLGSIATVSTEGGETLTLATRQGRPHFVATDGTYVWWTAPTDGTVMRVPLAGGATETLAYGELAPYGILLDGDRLYWVNTGYPTGVVRSMSASGGEVTTLYDGEVWIANITQNSTSLYWMEPDEGRVMRLAKPL